MVPSLFLKILDFIVHKISRGNSRILFLSQRPDLLSWFYVYLSDFGLLGNLIHHLALYPVSVRTLERIATPLSSILDITVNDLWFTTLGGNYLWSAYLRLNSCHARHTLKKRSFNSSLITDLIYKVQQVSVSVRNVL